MVDGVKNVFTYKLSKFSSPEGWGVSIIFLHGMTKFTSYDKTTNTLTWRPGDDDFGTIFLSIKLTDDNG